VQDIAYVYMHHCEDEHLILDTDNLCTSSVKTGITEPGAYTPRTGLQNTYINNRQNTYINNLQTRPNRDINQNTSKYLFQAAPFSAGSQKIDSDGAQSLAMGPCIKKCHSR